jgi:eukaryotic-like serine/threonine-protein kinase
MSDESRVQRLVEELLDSGATPEEVCRSCPELLPEVRARWRQVRSVQAELDAMFPTVIVGGSPTSFSAKETALPRIEGYVVESVLGRGGMGIVFRARHLRLNRVVALKMALTDAYAGPLELQRFQREAEAVAQLQHPHVVQIYDVGDSEGRPYFTMEYVDGGTLAQHLAESPLSTPQAAALLLETLARAVEVAHRNGIVHRDLKPANVLFTIDGVPKISDFGLARRVDSDASLTPAGSALGTPSYMAPEQARGNATEIGPAADIHALGAILYETLTGRPPFEAESAAETLQQVVSLEPAPPSRLNAMVPRDLETICLKCLQKQPQRRYSSASALADDLYRFQRGQPILARRTSAGTIAAMDPTKSGKCGPDLRRARALGIFDRSGNARMGCRGRTTP